MLVKTLLEKSFAVGLSETVDEALQSGVAVSRAHLESLQRRFEDDVNDIALKLDPDAVMTPKEFPAAVSVAIEGTSVDGFVIDDGSERIDATLDVDVPPRIHRFFVDPAIVNVTRDIQSVTQRPVASTLGVEYYDADDRSLQFAHLGNLLFYDVIEAEFIENADRAVSGLQIFARLRLAQEDLSRSFFYPFMIIYAIMLVLSLGIALLISERMSQPIRRLADATNIVATGDWSYRLDVKAGGETGQLVDAFNEMVSRLDEQSRRLLDTERIATWRDIARYLAHEIKNPLLPIRLTAQELKDQYKGDDDRFRNILDESTRVIGDEVEHLTKLVREFSAFARMPALKKTAGSLHGLIEDVAKLYPQLSVTLSLDAQVTQFAFDSDQMRRVFVNLFDNVVSMTAEGGAEVSASTHRHGDDVVVEFADNGPGMSAETLAKAFEPYFTTRGEGTGLGLAMVKSIVVLHGGSVTVDSQVGKGTTFRIVLPLFDKNSDQHKE